MRRMVLAALWLSLLCVAGAATASQVDVLWWDGADQFDQGPNVAIHPFAGGTKVGLDGDTSAGATRTQQLVITDYSRTWDVSLEAIGAKKQADIFLSFTNTGISAYAVSLRFDSNGDNMLNVVAAREYNVSVGALGTGTTDDGLGLVNTCEPVNNCQDSALDGTGVTALNGFGSLVFNNESEAGQAGYIYSFASIAGIDVGPATKNSSQTGTIRIGSVLFELAADYGRSDVQVGFFNQPGASDSIVNNLGQPGQPAGDPNEATIDSGAPAVVLASTFCGDGVLQAAEGEQCDDGNNANDDGCSASCQDEVCGDGIQQAIEGCDDGNTDSNDGCSATCVAEFCGDSIQQSSEACDDGNMVDEDGCSAACVVEVCGDGVQQAGLGETCDDGNTDSNDGCSATCVAEFCGDSIQQSSEACDDGNMVDEDGCSAACVVEVCGDGVQQAGLGETCDDGNTDSDDGCSATCLLEVCGDGVQQSSEGCDDGNTTDGDGCSAVCVAEVCGDGVQQVGLGEQCDDGNTDSDDGCSATCLLEVCGDGVQQSSEGCDDGNVVTENCPTAEACTVCGSDCTLVPGLISCGDGVVDAGEDCDDGNRFTESCSYGEMSCTVCSESCTDVAGSTMFCGDSNMDVEFEICDDGNAVDDDYCSDDCQTSGECGDGVVQSVEICDDGNEVDDDYCANDCQTERFCGDGTLEQAEGEECDDGNIVSGDGCSDVCVVEFCGDAETQEGLGEVCDDGNAVDDDYCSDDCQTSGECGDTIVQSVELCDDGNAVDDDYCTNDCQSDGACGDEILQAGVEVCDDGNTDDQDLCSSTCQFPVDACQTGVLIEAFPFSVTGTTLPATSDAGDPTPSCGMGSDGATVWYELEFTEEMDVTIDTDGSGYDTVVSVYTDGCSETPAEVACNDDEPPASMAAPVASANGSSKLEFTADAATRYSVMIGSRNGSSGGALSLMITAIPEPAAALMGFAALAVLSQLRRRRR